MKPWGAAVPLSRLIVVRHGETAWNVEGRIQGQHDVPLNATGERQAGQLAHALHGERIDALVVSDLQRAVQTARPIEAVTGLTMTTEAGLRERHFGVFEGWLSSEIAERWPVESALWHLRDPEAAPPEGESLASFSSRAVGSVLRIAAGHAGKCVALVVHGGVLDCLYRAATGTDLQTARSWPLPNAAVNRLDVEDGRLRIVAWGDTSHIAGTVRDEPVDAAAVQARRR